MFERFTERARQVVVLAQDEARSLGHSYIGTEHLLLGLLREEEGIAARVLESFGATLEEVRAMVAQIVGRGDEVPSGQIPFTPRAKKVLELALREAVSMKHNYIGTEHVLLGLARDDEGIATRILLDFDVDAERIRGEVVGRLSSPGVRRRPEASAPPRRFELPSPPFTPEVADEVRRLKDEKETAIAEQRFDEAAALRDRERHLMREARRFEDAWNAREAPPQLLSAERAGTERHRPVVSIAAGADPGGFSGPRGLFALGWLLFGIAFGVGVLVGLAASA